MYTDAAGDGILQFVQPVLRILVGRAVLYFKTPSTSLYCLCMDYTAHTQRSYDVIAEDYLNDHLTETWDDDYLKLFASLVPAGSAILELGCGPGIDVKKLRLLGYHVHGLDISERILRIARRLNPDSEFTHGDMRQLPFPDASFTGIFAKASLFHISKHDMSTVLHEVHRTLEPTGIFHVAVMKKKAGQKDGLATHDRYGLPSMQYVSYWTMRELTTALTRAGFTVSRSTETADHDTGTTWLKTIASRAA